MKDQRFFLTFFLTVVVQILLCNYLNLSMYVVLSILPVAILMVPVRYDTPVALILAFVSGLAVDWLSEGLIGLNAVALVPVAACRRRIIQLVFGDEVFARGDDISIGQHGVLKMSISIILAQAVFMLFYVWADGAATRPFWFDATRFLLSVTVGWLVSLLVSEAFVKDQRNR